MQSSTEKFITWRAASELEPVVNDLARAGHTINALLEFIKLHCDDPADAEVIVALAHEVACLSHRLREDYYAVLCRASTAEAA